MSGTKVLISNMNNSDSKELNLDNKNDKNINKTPITKNAQYKRCSKEVHINLTYSDFCYDDSVFDIVGELDYMTKE